MFVQVTWAFTQPERSIPKLSLTGHTALRRMWMDESLTVCLLTTETAWFAIHPSHIASTWRPSCYIIRDINLTVDLADCSVTVTVPLIDSSFIRTRTPVIVFKASKMLYLIYKFYNCAIPCLKTQTCTVVTFIFIHFAQKS